MKSRQSHGLPDLSPNAHYPLTPCSSIDPSAIDPEEIQRIRRVQVTAGIDPEQLAKGLAGISIAHSSPSRSPNSTNSTASPQTTPSGSFSSKQINHTSNKSKDLEKCLESIQKQQFDVFLSFAEADERFAEEVRQRLIENAGVRVFVPSAGLMSDRAFHQEIADIIKQGCTRTVVILSPDYLSSSWCGYEANLAFTNSPDARRNTTIPILYRPCEVPAFLSHLHYLDYPRFKDDRKNCQDYFWKRLYKSVTHHI
uniref:Toll-like receptor adapter protein n=1 Tax=Suberites domuncula TaxID=55567 RepID=Q4W1E7_SUBDO|nr:Toll-like receptor adapter protein [Suberites domuncula]